MKDFKFFKNDESVATFNLMEYENQFTIRQPIFQPNNVDFCFQFDDEEAIVFASGPNDLRFNISPTENGNITFSNNNGKTFKIFARERQNG